MPGSIWGCKCSAKSTDAPVSNGNISPKNMPAASPGLDTNPAKDAKLFSDTHPYVSKTYPGAKKAVEKRIGTYVEAKTKNGKVRYHTKHGKKEKAENVQIASYFANKYGHEIDLLPIDHNKKTPDALNKTLKQLQEYKTIAKSSKSAVDEAIRKAKNQADYIVLKIDTEIENNTLAGAIQNRVRRAENIKEITIIKSRGDKTYTREDILDNDFTL